VTLGFLLLALFPPDRGLAAALAALLVIGLAGSTMDIATDAYAVELLEPSERGIGNGLQAAGLAGGVLVGEALMLILVDRFGWATTMAILAGLVLVIATPGLLRREPPPPREATGTASVLPGLGRFFQRPEAIATLVLALFTGLCYYLIGLILGPFLVDKGLTLTQIGSIGAIGTVLEVAGALLGGASVNFLGFRRAYGGILVSGLVVAIAGIVISRSSITELAILAPVIWAARLLHGASFAVFYANVMNWCSRSQAATDYTMMSSVYSATAVLGGSLSSVSAGLLGYQGHFLAVAAFHVASIVVFLILHPRITAGAARSLHVPESELVGVPPRRRGAPAPG
jgi:MFS family permease